MGNPFIVVPSGSPTPSPYTSLLDQAKEHMRIHSTFTDDDAYISTLILAAESRCELQCRRSFVIATKTLSLDKFPAGEIQVPYPPLSIVNSVKYYDSDNVQITLTENTDYEVDLTATNGLIRPCYDVAWPETYSRYGAVLISYDAGYAASDLNLPTPLIYAILMFVAHLYEHRETVSDVAMTEVPMSVQYLLEPYVVAGCASP